MPVKYPLKQDSPTTRPDQNPILALLTDPQMQLLIPIRRGESIEWDLNAARLSRLQIHFGETLELLEGSSDCWVCRADVHLDGFCSGPRKPMARALVGYVEIGGCGSNLKV
jgi:hypothetical protein